MGQRKSKELKEKDISTTIRVFKKYNQLKITIREYFFMVRIYKLFEDLDAFIASYGGDKTESCAGAFLRNLRTLKKKNGCIGTIALTYQALTRPIIIHECTHAALGYHSLIFNGNTDHENIPTSIGINREEEFFCTLISCLCNEIFNYAEGSYRILMHVKKRMKTY